MDLLLYLLVLIIPLIAQINVSSTFAKYKQVANSKGMCGQEVARAILDANGLNNVHVVEVRGTLSDHYDSNQKVVRLSTDVFHGETIGALAVAAHECGHAIQDKEGYMFMRFRSFLFPLVKFGTQFAYIILFVGLLVNMFNLIWVGILLVFIGLLFQIVTLPVEFDASKKALIELSKKVKINSNEIDGVKKMLSSAALTYVSSVLSSVLELLRLILIFTNNDRD